MIAYVQAVWLVISYYTYIYIYICICTSTCACLLVCSTVKDKGCQERYKNSLSFSVRSKDSWKKWRERSISNKWVSITCWVKTQFLLETGYHLTCTCICSLSALTDPQPGFLLQGDAPVRVPKTWVSVLILPLTIIVKAQSLGFLFWKKNGE
jgi:hypothetical protein